MTLFDMKTAKGPIGIIAAMRHEAQLLVKGMDGVVEKRCGWLDCTEGSIAGVDCVVAVCGEGKVNAGMAAQVLVDVYGVSALINTGIAGTLDPELGILDVAISDDASYHDFDMSPIGWDRGVLPNLGIAVFEADPVLRDVVLEAAKEVAEGAVVKTGRVLTGDQFIGAGEYKDFLRDGLGGICCEMEGAAIAHAAHMNGIPFVIVRTISDGTSSDVEMDYRSFEDVAAARGAEITRRTIARLAAR